VALERTSLEMATSMDYEKQPLPDDDEVFTGGSGSTSVRYVPSSADEAMTRGASPCGGAMRPDEQSRQRELMNKKKRSAPQQSLNSCSMCIRYILIVGNCIFFLFGCTVIGLGIYLVVDKVNLVSGVFGSPLIAPASYLIIAAGCIVFIISFIGCFGSLFESRSVLILYSTALGLVLLLSIIGFVLAIVFRSKVNDQIRTYMTETLQKEYGVNLENDWNRMITDAWDRAQIKWYCCAVNDQGYGAYKASEWYKQQPAPSELLKPLVPESCCVRDQYGKYLNKEKCQTWPLGPPSIQSTDRNNALYDQGC